MKKTLKNNKKLNASKSDRPQRGVPIFPTKLEMRLNTHPHTRLDTRKTDVYGRFVSKKPKKGITLSYVPQNSDIPSGLSITSRSSHESLHHRSSSRNTGSNLRLAYRPSSTNLFERFAKQSKQSFEAQSSNKKKTNESIASIESLKQPPVIKGSQKSSSFTTPSPSHRQYCGVSQIKIIINNF